MLASGERDYGWVVFGPLFLLAAPFLVLSGWGLFSFGQGWAATYGVTGTQGTVTITGLDRDGHPRTPATCQGDFQPDRGGRRPGVQVEHSGECRPDRRLPARLAAGTAYEAGVWSWSRFMVTVLVTVLFVVTGIATLGFGGAFVQLARQHFRGDD
ncbi:hypothetical protein [Actinomadura sp. 7K507]|uniref:hypothetical protein n=1 Tax=Actinomadura sp. 7K507 TaxID=2530365 RepID=UPI00104F8CBB|nr:hypothetical protein [Actinomadura sp. 7K507]TDC80081.1 hypothetical protein E1285_35245 [Actinomadura sp. 7K507]